MDTLSSCTTPLEISISSADVDYNLSTEVVNVNGPFTESSANVLAELDPCNDFVDVSYLSSTQFLSSKDPDLINDSIDMMMEKSSKAYQDPLLNQGNMPVEAAETAMKSVSRSTAECDTLKDDYIDFSLLSMIGYGFDCSEPLELIHQEKGSDFSSENKSRPLILRKGKVTSTPLDSTSADKNMNISRSKSSPRSKKVLTEETKPVIIKNINSSSLLNINLINKLKRATTGNKHAPSLIADISTETESARIVIKINVKTAKGDEVLFRNENKGPDSKYIAGSYLINRVVCANNLENKGKCTKAQQSEFDDDFINDVLKKHSITDDVLFCIVTTTGLNMWLCPYVDCGRAVYKLHALKRHLVIHFGIKPFKCDFPNCKWSFYTSFRLKRHQETHLKIKMFKCSEENCDRTFTTIYNLRCHRKLHERPANIKCLVETCNMYFQTLKARETHLKTHQRDDAPYKCLVNGCGKVYFSFNSLTAHSRAHSHKESELKCSWPNCGRMFDQPCRLKEHMRQHTGDKPYVCDYKDCTWAFPSASKLRRHQNTHRKERPYHCTIGNCTKAFFRSEHLKEHTLTHIAQRTFQCEICQSKFSSKSSIYMHHKKAHPGLCQQTTLTSYLKNEHLEQEIIQANLNDSQDALTIENMSAVLMNDNEVLIRIPEVVDLSSFNIDIADITCKKSEKCNTIEENEAKQKEQEPNPDIILQQAIQSLDVPSDIMLSGNQDNILTGLLLTEEAEFDERSNLTQLLDVSDNNFSESTINLRDLD